MNNDARRTNGHRRRQFLAVRRAGLNSHHHRHAADHLAKGCEALPVRIAATAEVELRLITDANEKLGGGVIGVSARHGHCAIEMMQAGVLGAFKFNGREHPELLVGISLDYRNRHRGIGLVVGAHGAPKIAAAVRIGRHVLQEITGGARRVREVNGNSDFTKLRVEQHSIARHLAAMRDAA